MERLRIGWFWFGEARRGEERGIGDAVGDGNNTTTAGVCKSIVYLFGQCACVFVSSPGPVVITMEKLARK